MSNPLAIATVTATLSQFLLTVTADSGLQGVNVSTRPPDAARAAGDTGRQINLFLYGVTPNLGWGNMDLPIRGATGTMVTQPVLPLDLHYLLTVYGQNDDDLDAQHLLAYAMSLLHDQPVLSRDQIRAAVQADGEIGESDLADQVEMIKLCQHALTPDDLYKLWSAFQIHYRLSTAYDASVVLIERPQPTHEALPVLQPKVFTLPFREPVIDSISPQVVASNGKLTIRGRNLKAGIVQVSFGPTVIPVTPISDTEIIVDLAMAQPAAPGGTPAVLIDSLQAGVNTVQVVQPLNLGSPPSPQRGVESNIVPFALAPQITNQSPMTVAAGGTLSVGVVPAVGRLQTIALLLDDQALSPNPPAAGTTTSASVEFAIPSTLGKRSYLARLRVDGAESALTVDAATGMYSAPTVIVQ